MAIMTVMCESCNRPFDTYSPEIVRECYDCFDERNNAEYDEYLDSLEEE